MTSPVPTDDEATQSILCSDIDKHMCTLRAALSSTLDQMQQAFLLRTFIGSRLNELRNHMREVGRKKGALYNSNGFNNLVDEKWHLSSQTARLWIKTASEFGKYLVVTQQGDQINLAWSEDMPLEQRQLSLRGAIRAIDEKTSPEDGKSPAKKREPEGWAQSVYKHAASISKTLEKSPVAAREPQECYDLVESLRPIIHLYKEAIERASSDPKLAPLVKAIEA